MNKATIKSLEYLKTYWFSDLEVFAKKNHLLMKQGEDFVPFYDDEKPYKTGEDVLIAYFKDQTVAFTAIGTGYGFMRIIYVSAAISSDYENHL